MPKEMPVPSSEPIALTFEQLKELLSTAQAAKSSSPELEVAIAGLKATMEATDKLQTEVGRTVRKSNATNQNISVFSYKADCEFCVEKKPHPDTELMGHPVPPLKFSVVEFPDKGWKVWPDQSSIT